MQTERPTRVAVADGAMAINEAVELSGFSRSFLYKLMENGQLAYIKIGKARRIPRRSLLDLLERSLVTGK
jgi:excisionase family DNA binding protein